MSRASDVERLALSLERPAKTWPAEVVSEHRKRLRLFLALERVRKVSTGHPCPGRVVGWKRCDLHGRRPFWATGHPQRCPCDMAGWGDHAQAFLTEAGIVVVGQPYVDYESRSREMSLARLRAWCSAEGASVEVSDERSWHYPGRTTLVTVRRA